MTAGGGDGISLNPDEVHSGANSLGSLGDDASGHLDKLNQISDRVTSHASGDRSGVGKVLITGITKAVPAIAKTGTQAIRVVKAAAQRLHVGTDAHVENEHNQKGILDGIHPEEKKITPKSEKEGEPSSSSSTTPSSMHEPPKPKGEPGEDATPPLLGKNKPPTATDNHSQQFTERPDLPKAEPFSEKLPDSDVKSYGQPPDKARGAKVEQISEDRVTRGDDGLITHVDGKPIKQYIGEVSKQKAEDSANPTKVWQDANPGVKKTPKGVPGKEKVCSAVAIDRKTGLVTHGINGKADDVIPEQNLHPLLQQNLQDLRGWQHKVTKEDGSVQNLDGKAHESVPANHAEVKAVNELLWQRQSQLPAGQTLHPDTMKEIGFDPRWTKDTNHGSLGGEAPACANCNTILKGATSYTGRYQHAPFDVQYKTSMIPPAS